MAEQGLHPDQENHCSAFPCREENREESHSSVPEEPDMQKPGRSADPAPAGEAHRSGESPTKVIPKEPKIRTDFLKYWTEITLDPNTANARLLLSDGNRKATNVEDDQPYPSHPDRFLDGHLVLGKESLTGRHYWEVERSGGAVSVAVAYKHNSRTGTESNFGCNDKSWALDCFDSRYVVRHVYIQAARPCPVSCRVGVYLDHRAGVLSFYSVSDTMTLLHRVQTTFTRPLHAGLWVHGYRSTAVFCHKDSS